MCSHSVEGITGFTGLLPIICLHRPYFYILHYSVSIYYHPSNQQFFTYQGMLIIIIILIIFDTTSKMGRGLFRSIHRAVGIDGYRTALTGICWYTT